MIWQCLDEHGNVSEPYVSRETMNGKIFLEVLKKRLLPFIQKYRKIENVIFWMDLATCHF